MSVVNLREFNTVLTTLARPPYVDTEKKIVISQLCVYITRPAFMTRSYDAVDTLFARLLIPIYTYAPPVSLRNTSGIDVIT